MRFLLMAVSRIAVKILILLIVINLLIILISGSEFSFKQLFSISSIQERMDYLWGFLKFTYHKFTGAFCDWVNEFRQETPSDES